MGVLRDIYAIRQGQAGGGDSKSKPKRVGDDLSPGADDTGGPAFETYDPDSKRPKRANGKRT